ncbi:hypothetical protein RHGRI_011515 [Rhododendron griersonianum]|uniref:Uncharacterized protein n=1 Tax=Rhododendron griersonianum TaxID=479676 RepID=A0AAV6KM23_9ERIC|nr:hypothetical protein RHGRI_011515 [Rhododendron griersonianum]
MGSDEPFRWSRNLRESVLDLGSNFLKEKELLQFFFPELEMFVNNLCLYLVDIDA